MRDKRLARSRAAWLVLCAALASLAFAQPADPRSEARKLIIENEILKKQIELASQDSFVLVLDPSRETLALLLKGAVLRTYHVSHVEIGDPRVAFVSRAQTLSWQGKIWSKGTLVPARQQDRMEIVPPPPGAGEDDAAEPAVPPTPEEKYPVPHRYGIRFEDGLFLEVLPAGESSGPGLLGSIGAWWEDFREVTRLAPTDRLRLRLSLRQEDCEALYRSLPPDTKLLALPPG